VFELGENLTSRYKVLSKMGEGTFGRVLECWDRKHRDYVAIKIVRNIDKYRHAAMIELEVLNTLERNDQSGSRHCVALREWFDYRGHVCMVFEKLGPSLFDFLRKNEYRPFPMDLVQEFSRQLLESVAYLHELQLIHTDLKPENILLVSLDFCRSASVTSGRRPTASRVVPSSSAIKVIDFGSATFEDQHHSSVVSTRHYRAPEVILGLGWSYPCDMWSIGCIITELLTGDALFQMHENLEHLAMMEQVLGPMPDNMAARSAKLQCSKYFAGSRLAWPDGATSKKSVKAVAKLRGLRRHLLENGDSSGVPHMELIVDLVSRMLAYEPSERLTAQQALAHPFMQLSLPPSIPPPLPSPHMLGSQMSQAGSLATSFTAAATALTTSIQGMEGNMGMGMLGNNGVPFPHPLSQLARATVTTAATTASTATTTLYGW
jgi:dual-specificity kinase